MRKKTILLWILLPLLVGGAAYLIQPIDLGTRLLALVRGSPAIDVPDVIDLGSREQGEIAVAVFSVGNHGNAPLVLDGFQSNCGCSGVEKVVGGIFTPLQSATISPGEHLDLALRFPVRGESGSRLMQRAAFRSNDPRRETVTVEITTRVRGRVFAIPQTLSLGSIPCGGSINSTARVAQNRRENRRLPFWQSYRLPRENRASAHVPALYW
jgi:hypothetical protein